jgi:hypothetical protein
MPLIPPLDFSSTYLESGERLCGKVAAIVELTFDKRLYALAQAIDITPRGTMLWIWQ